MDAARIDTAMDSFDLFNIALDGYSALLCAMMGAKALVAARGRRDEVSRCFAGICLANTVMALGDITSWLLRHRWIKASMCWWLAGSFAYYAAVMPLYLFFTGYIVSYLERRTQLAPAVRRAIPRATGGAVRGVFGLLRCLAVERDAVRRDS